MNPCVISLGGFPLVTLWSRNGDRLKKIKPGVPTDTPEAFLCQNVQSLIQISDQVFGVLYANRKAHQIILDANGKPFFR